MKRWWSNSLGAFLIGASALGVYNVVADNAYVESMAKEVACGGGVGKTARATCTAHKSQMVRTPWDQSFEFATTDAATKKTASVNVRCARDLILLGEYGCELR